MKVSANIVPKIIANGKTLCGRRLGLLLFTEFRTGNFTKYVTTSDEICIFQHYQRITV
jgi:hypothetical protein